MQTARQSQVDYLLAELGALADELSRQTGTLTRSQLACLADRAQGEVAAIAAARMSALVRTPSAESGGGKIIPLFGR